MGSDCCKNREKELAFSIVKQPRAKVAGFTAAEKLLQRLAHTSPPIRHPVLFRYDLGEVLRFLHVCNYDLKQAEQAILADLRWRIKRPPSPHLLSQTRNTRQVFFFETDFEQIPVLVVKGVMLDACFEVLHEQLDKAYSSYVTVLLDADNALPVELMLGLLSFFRQHYPRRLRRLLVVRANVSELCTAQREQLRSFHRILHIFAANYQRALQRYIPPERLLHEYGGLRKYSYSGGPALRTSFARYRRPALLSA